MGSAFLHNGIGTQARDAMYWLGQDDILSDNLVEKAGEDYVNNRITHIVQYGLAGLTTLHSVTMEKLRTSGGSAFRDCINLESINLPSFTSPSTGYLLAGDEYLVEANLGYMPTISRYAFKSCRRLQHLCLAYNGVVNIVNSNAFENAFTHASLPVSVYVPHNRIAAYKSATTWCSLYEQGKIEFYELGEWDLGGGGRVTG